MNLKSPNAVQLSWPPNELDYKRKASYINQNCKEHKFTSDITQSIKLALKNKNVGACQHKLSQGQKPDYFWIKLDSPARISFFFINARNSSTFNELATTMLRKCNSDACQIYVQGVPENSAFKSS